jgi:DNA/RNA endonuclease YhcR with UshA esterase domain
MRMRNVVFSVCALVVCASVSAQEPVINRGAPMTLTGEVVDISCYKQKGVAAGTGAAHVNCAKECVLNKGAALGILSDGDGLFRLWGSMAGNKYAKLMPYVGQTVTITGTEVRLSNNYDVRSFDLQTIKPAKKAG